MTTLEEFLKDNTRIVLNAERYTAFIDDEEIGEYAGFLEAEDMIYDLVIERLSETHKYKCDFCNCFYKESDVEHRINDRTFTAPFGSTFTIGGDIGTCAVCPTCKEDLEETEK